MPNDPKAMGENVQRWGPDVTSVLGMRQSIDGVFVEYADYATLQARLAACEADARRYRWLRVRWGRVGEQYDGATSRMVAIGDDPEGWEVDPESLDAAIDSAISAGGEVMEEQQPVFARFICNRRCGYTKDFAGPIVVYSQDDIPACPFCNPRDVSAAGGE